MESGPLHTLGSSGPAQVRSVPVVHSEPAVREYALIESTPDEPLAVVAVGSSGDDRRAVLGALLGGAAPGLRVPQGSFLVITYAPTIDSAAYVPGAREPRGYRSHPANAGAALARPPRRVELTVPDPLLRHFALVDTPDSDTLGVAGARVVRDAVRRAGALLLVISADQPFGTAELSLLAEVADEAAIFVAMTPDADGGWPPGGVNGHQAALVAAVPELAHVPWFALDPAAADTAYLRRALVDWASAEGLRRASGSPPVVPGATGTVRVAATVHASDWEDRLDRQVRTLSHRLRQDIALELANIHLRCVQEIVFGSGCAGLPGALDRELEALSLTVVASSDANVARILGDALIRVFGEALDEGVSRRAAAAVGWGLADNRGARDLDRVLLVTASGEVESRTGLDAVGALAAYPRAAGGALLPPFGVGLAGGCYQYWRNPAHRNADKARSWLQRALREIELELSREVSRRFEVVQISLAKVLAEAITHGSLLA